MTLLSKRPGLLSALAVTALLANPNVACSGASSDGDFSYGEADMRAVAVGTWTGALTIDGKTEGFTLVLEQKKARTPGAQTTGYRPLCGTREFLATAGACVSMSRMPLVGTLTSDGGTFDAVPVDGAFEAYATIDGTVSLDLDQGGTLTIDVREGKLTDGQFLRAGGAAGGTLTIDQR